MQVKLFDSATTMYMHPDFSTKDLEPDKKPYIHKTYSNIFPFMTQQEEDCLNNKPTSRTAGYSNAMVDSIVHDKMQELINQKVPFYQYPSEEEPVNDKNVHRTAPQQQVLIQSLWKALNNCSRFYFKITIQNKMAGTTLNNHLLQKGTMQMVYP